MSKKTNMQLDLTDSERMALRKNKVTKVKILNYDVDELVELLKVSENRTREIYALADFQQIPSIGIKFAKDLIFLGYYSVEELKDKSGAELTNAYEKQKGFKTDPCVEDQFRLVVNFAKHRNFSKSWWDFTTERKEYRSEHGYPQDRPKMNWTEVYFSK